MNISRFIFFIALFLSGCTQNKWTTMADAERMFEKGLTESSIKERYGVPDGLIGVPLQEGTQTRFLYPPEVNEVGFVYFVKKSASSYGSEDSFFVVWLKDGKSSEFIKEQLERKHQDMTANKRNNVFSKDGILVVPASIAREKTYSLSYDEVCKLFKKGMESAEVAQVFGMPLTITALNDPYLKRRFDCWIYAPFPTKKLDGNEIISTGFVIYFYDNKTIRIGISNFSNMNPPTDQP